MNPIQLPPAAPELTTHGLCLRPWQDSDADALHEAVGESIASVGRWLPWCHAGYGREDAVAWIAHCRASWAASTQFAFGIFDAASGVLLGSAGLSECNRPQRGANLGYWVRESRQRQGVAVAAAIRLARFGFEQCGLIRIEIVVLPDNRASRRTAEKTGAKFESIARQRLWKNEQALDAAVYALIPDDLR
ncbi:MAG TPA: GNAT family N-acetyltransferase [Rhodanobacter sp.]|nr:GNAT family N-acetyltransferase [Rhodanobacter sp.]